MQLLAWQYESLCRCLLVCLYSHTLHLVQVASGLMKQAHSLLSLPLLLLPLPIWPSALASQAVACRWALRLRCPCFAALWPTPIMLWPAEAALPPLPLLLLLHVASSSGVDKRLCPLAAAGG